MKKIKLEACQSTAYWWIEKIRTKIKEINNNPCTPEELEFASLFDNYTEIDWRNLYKELLKLIKGDIDKRGNKFLTQGTRKGQHNRINCELMTILEKLIPDINITTSGSKDSTIYTNSKITAISQTNDKTIQLLRETYPWFIITGNDTDLFCYNFLAATLTLIHEDCNSNKDFNKLRQGIIKGYRDYLLCDEDIESITERTDLAIEYAKHNGIIEIQDTSPETYKTKFTDSDYCDLDLYMEFATEIARDILAQDIKELEKKCMTKMRKK